MINKYYVVQDTEREHLEHHRGLDWHEGVFSCCLVIQHFFVSSIFEFHFKVGDNCVKDNLLKKFHFERLDISFLL